MDTLKKISTIILNCVKWIVIIFLTVLIILVVIRFVSQRIILSKAENQYISELKKVNLNNQEQKILIESNNTTRPIIIALHGGPGYPSPFGIGYRNVYTQLYNNYILVQWDQFGFGSNPGRVKSVNEYIPMLHELIEELKIQYQDQKIYFLSYSYGTIISALYATEYPNDIDGIFSIATFTSINRIINNYYQELQTYDLSKEDKEAMETYITKSDISSYEKATTIASNYISNFQGKNFPTRQYEKNLSQIIISPDYGINDLYNILRYKSTDNYKRLYRELDSLDMITIYEKITTPVLFIQGNKDIDFREIEITELESTNSNLSHAILNNCGRIITDGNWEVIWKAMREVTQ